MGEWIGLFDLWPKIFALVLAMARVYGKYVGRP